MKKIFICLVITATFIFMSCQSAPAPASSSGQASTQPSTSTTTPAQTTQTPAVTSRPQINGNVTQEKVNEALGQIYSNYRGKLDMAGASEYVVVRGDTLSQITRRFYGTLTDVGLAGTTNGFYFPILMISSPECEIVDPDLIEIGMVLRIPDLKKNLANSTARQAIIECLTDVAYIYNKKGKPDEEEGLLILANSLKRMN